MTHPAFEKKYTHNGKWPEGLPTRTLEEWSAYVEESETNPAVRETVRGYLTALEVPTHEFIRPSSGPRAWILASIQESIFPGSTGGSVKKGPAPKAAAPKAAAASKVVPKAAAPKAAPEPEPEIEDAEAAPAPEPEHVRRFANKAGSTRVVAKTSEPAAPAAPKVGAKPAPKVVGKSAAPVVQEAPEATAEATFADLMQAVRQQAAMLQQIGDKVETILSILSEK